MKRGETLDDRYYKMTQEEVAAALGLQRSDVRQIEKQALLKMRRAFKARGYTFQNLNPQE